MGFASPKAGRKLTSEQKNAILKAKPRPETRWAYEERARILGISAKTLRKIWRINQPPRITSEQKIKILDLLQDPRLSRRKIANLVKVSTGAIKRRETKSTARNVVRSPKKNFFNPRRKNEILNRFAGSIDNCARHKFYRYKDLFRAIGIDSALELAQQIRLKILEQLDYFDPEREKLRGLTEEQKIEHFVNFKIPKIAAELAREATRKNIMQRKLKKRIVLTSSGRATEPVVKNPPMALIGLHEFAKLPFGLQQEIIQELIKRMPLLKKRRMAIRQAIKLRAQGIPWNAIAAKQRVSSATPAILLSAYRNLMRKIIQQIIQERGIRV
jgi:hypothetical protein